MSPHVVWRRGPPRLPASRRGYLGASTHRLCSVHCTNTCLGNKLERTLTPLREQSEKHVVPVHLQKHRELSDQRLSERNAGTRLPHDAQRHQVLADRLAEMPFG